jgi:hypothetical protein
LFKSTVVSLEPGNFHVIALKRNVIFIWNPKNSRRFRNNFLIDLFELLGLKEADNFVLLSQWEKVFGDVDEFRGVWLQTLDEIGGPKDPI